MISERLLSLCMIVKDEEDNLPRCLNSVKDVVDEIIIVDTGSTDKTVEIAKSYGAKVYFYEWKDDFSGPRNLSIDKASSKWILVLDADEELAAETKALIRPSLTNHKCEGFNWKLKNFFESLVPTFEMGLCFRVFKNNPTYRYSGDIHEQMTVSILKHTPNAIFITEDILINHYGYQDEQVQKKKKKARNLRILTKQAINQTYDNRSFFNYNIGMEYYRQGKVKKAYCHFSEATKGLSPHASYAPKLDRYIISCLQRLKQNSKALDKIKESLKKYPDYIDLFFLRGTIHLSLGKYNKAIIDFCKCLEHKELPEWYCSVNGLNSFRAYYNLGLTFEKLMDYEQAFLGYDKAIKAEPQFTLAIHGLIRILKNLGKSPTEIRGYLVSNFDFNNSSPLFLWSLLFSSGLYQESWGTLPQQDDQGEPFLNYCKAITLLKLKRFNEAFYFFTQDYNYAPSLREPALVNLCLCCWIKGDLRKSSEIIPLLENLDINPYIKLTYSYFQQLLEGNIIIPPKIPRRQISQFNKTTFNLIDALLEASEFDKANLALTLLFEEKGSNHTLTFVELLIKYNYLDIAEKLIKENFSDDQKSSFYLLGTLAEKKSDYMQAFKHFKDFIFLNPKREDVYLKIPRLIQLIHTSCDKET